jgi:hypothetical protein
LARWDFRDPRGLLNLVEELRWASFASLGFYGIVWLFVLPVIAIGYRSNQIEE